jgi:hypothetical protein
VPSLMSSLSSVSFWMFELSHSLMA